ANPDSVPFAKQQSFRLDHSPGAGLAELYLAVSWVAPNNDFANSRQKIGLSCPFKLPERGFTRFLTSRPPCSNSWAYTELYHNVSIMAKFIFSMGNENYRKLQLEAKTRDVTIQA